MRVIKDKIEIKRTDNSNKDFKKLTAQQDIELHEQYQHAQLEYDRYNKIDSIDTALIVNYDGRAIACGCFKEMDRNTVEIKRVFVVSEFRGNGISKLLLKELEKLTKELGYSRIILETGVRQSTAIALYSVAGYRRIENYGKYKYINTSVCYEKQLEN